MFTDKDSTGDRLRAVIPVAAIHAGLAFVLLRGLTPGLLSDENETLKLVHLPPPEQILPDLQPPPPPPPAQSRAQKLRQADPRPEGAASPPNLKAEPTPVVAPDQVVATETPQPLVAAQKPGTGAAASAGAAAVRGPGTGSGGVATGRGSGRGGGGYGGGGGGGGGGYGSGRVMTMPRLLRGRFSARDIPEPLQEAGFQGRVGLRFIIDVDGRAKNCRIVRSSGSRLMDQAACRALETRFRFAPARDEWGRAIAIPGEDNPDFGVDDLPPDEPPPRRRRMGW
jgi:protein TonB